MHSLGSAQDERPGRPKATESGLRRWKRHGQGYFLGVTDADKKDGFPNKMGGTEGLATDCSHELRWEFVA